jgi:hypothetical protein
MECCNAVKAWLTARGLSQMPSPLLIGVIVGAVCLALLIAKVLEQRVPTIVVESILGENGSRLIDCKANARHAIFTGNQWIQSMAKACQHAGLYTAAAAAATAALTGLSVGSCHAPLLLYRLLHAMPSGPSQAADSPRSPGPQMRMAAAACGAAPARPPSPSSPAMTPALWSCWATWRP